MSLKRLIAGACLLAAGLGGCAGTPTDQQQCGSFDTERLRADLKAPFRTDREWYETLIKRLAWQLDCERRPVSTDFCGGPDK